LTIRHRILSSEGHWGGGASAGKFIRGGVGAERKEQRGERGREREKEKKRKIKNERKRERKRKREGEPKRK
jgi:hypothetical protein